MMIRGPIVAVLFGSAAIVLTVGCSDPSNGILPVGMIVIIADGTKSPVRVWVVGPGSSPPAEAERLDIADGTRASVVRDGPVETHREQTLRLTRLRLLDGPRAGTVIEVARYKLRPPR